MLRSIHPAPAAAAFLLLTACEQTSSEPGNVFAPSVTNLGLAARAGELAGDGDLWLFAARESESGRDLNQDGDALDSVVHVQNLATGTTLITGLALDPRTTTPILGTSATAGIFAAAEQGSGGRDLNGDGDQDDAVLHVVEASSGSIRNLALALPLEAGPQPAVDDDLVAFTVSESGQGTDLDGDGALMSNVLHVHDVVLGTTMNTLLDLGRSPVFVGGGRVGFFVSESTVDLNGDGDARDAAVFHVFDPTTATSASSGLATAGFAPLSAGHAWLLLVPESEEGGIDLDGDGDAEDLVAHAFDARTSDTRNLGLACPGPEFTLASPASAGRERFALLASEDSRDLNGDGDFADLVAFLYDPVVDRLINSQRAAVRAVFTGQRLAFLVLEAAQGDATSSATDLNGDGDAHDAVVHLLDPATAATTNLRVDALDLVGTDELLLLLRAEKTVSVDWNLDGDLEDVVVHAFDPDTRESNNTRIASVDALGATAGAILLYADEAGEGRDLNADGDLSDFVFVLHERARSLNASLNLAGGLDRGRFGTLTRTGHVVLLADEVAQGRDLNSDGDRFDTIFHRAE